MCSSCPKTVPWYMHAARLQELPTEGLPADVVMLADSPEARMPTALGYRALPKPFQFAILSNNPAATLARTVSVLQRSNGILSKTATVLQSYDAKTRMQAVLSLYHKSIEVS